MRPQAWTVRIATGVGGLAGGRAMALGASAGGEGATTGLEVLCGALLLVALALALGLGGLALAYRRRLARARLEARADRDRLQADCTTLTQALQEQAAQQQRASAVRGEWAVRLEGDMLAKASGIAAASRSLMHGALTPDQREQAAGIDVGVRDLRASLGLLADSVRLEDDALSLAPAPFDVDDLLRDFGEWVSTRTAMQGRELIVEVEPDVPHALLADAPRLQYLLQAQFDRLAGSDVSTDWLVHIGLDQPRVDAPLPETGERVLLRFEFCAVGLAGAGAADARPDLDEALRQRLLELMQGQSGLRDAPGTRPVAWFTAQVQAARTGPEVEAWAPLRGRRVLVVDDKEQVRAMLLKLLGHWGVMTTAVASGYAAVEAAAAAEKTGPGFDLVLLDAAMPELDGLETVKLLHARGLRVPPLVVLTSQAASGPLLAQAQAAGVAEVLAKPLRRGALRQALLHLLSQRRAGQLSAVSKVQREAGLPAGVQALSGARVLLVEDNEINQQIGLELLQASGMEVQVAADGQAALDLLNWQYFDLVLMDLQMPVLDGLAATRQIRADRRFKDLPVVAMTAAGSQLERQRCLEAGMNAHLIKPFDLDSLWAVLQRWIAPRPGLGQADADAEGPADEGDAVQPPALRLPAALPGFDVHRALRRMGDRVDLYLRTARMFVDTQAGTVALVREAFDAGDRETAIRLATTLKNLASNLGAEGLRTEALALEACLREGADGLVKAHAARVEEALEVTCFAIKPMLLAAAAKGDKPGGAPASATGPAA